MKIAFCFLYLCLFLIFCSPAKKSGLTHREHENVYTVPYGVSELLEKKIRSSSDDSIYFEIFKLSENHFIIYMNKMYKDSKYNLVNRSLKTIYINKKFYPLLFDYDYSFMVSGTKADFMKAQSDTAQTIAKKGIVISHTGYYVEFYWDGVYKISKYGEQ